MLQIPLNIQLDDSSNFENFYIGSNQQLVSKLSHLNNIDSAFIYVWGMSGTGKSHLAQATIQQLAKHDQMVAYLPLSNKNITIEALENLQSFDLVCIDSFDQIVGSSVWQEAVFNLYNQLKLSGGKLIIFAKMSPNLMQLELKDLESRLGSMDIYRLNVISDDNKSDFVINLAKSRGIELSKEVANFLLVRTSRDVAYLKELIQNLDLHSLAHKRSITIPFIKETLNL